MPRRQVTHAATGYTVADDDPPPPDLRFWAVLRVRVVDEITGRPPLAPIRLTTEAPHCQPRVTLDGICGLAARPRDVSSLLVTPGRLRAEVTAPGYLPRSLDAAIDAARRGLPVGAGAGVTTVTVVPPDSVPREQFLPGRGVTIERPQPHLPEEVTLVDEPLAPTPPNQVGLDDAVRTARLPASRLSGVPIVLPDQPLHVSQPARVRGRLRRQTVPGGAPIAAPASSLGISGVWWTLPEVRASSVPTHPPHFVSLSAPLSFAHAAGGSVEDCTIAPDGVDRRTLARTFAAGTELLVAPWAGLAPAGGDLLQLEIANSLERELVVTASMTPGATPTAPARVRLRAPLSFPHANDTAVSLVAVAALLLTTVGREALPGDRVLFGADLSAAPTQGLVRLEAGSPREELRFTRRPPVFAGGVFTHPVPISPDGTFDLPPLARVAQVRIRADHAGQAPLGPVDVVPRYDEAETPVSILFLP